MPAHPFFSVIIPAYGTAAYIAETLDGVFAQGEASGQERLEVIVVNDGSPDTPALELALAPYRERITYLVQANAGPSAARNRAIDAAHGTWVALLDSDDVWLPGYLAAHRRALAHDPGVALLFSDGVIEGGPLDGRRLMEVAPSHPQVTVERLITEACTVLTSCTIVRRDAVLAAGGFPSQFRRSEDAHLWLRIAMQGGRIAWHPAPLVRHRRRAGSLADDTPAMVAAYIDVLEDLDARLPFTPAQRRLVRRQIARRRSRVAFEDGRRRFAAGEYAAAAGALGHAYAWEPALPAKLKLGLLRVGVLATPRLLHRAWSWRHGG